MARLRLGLLVISFLCGCGAASFAQDSLPPLSTDPASAAPAQAPVKKSPHKKAGAAAALTLAPSSDEAEKAARLAEGRKKFFEQSSGFENNDSGNPLSLGGSNGTKPTMGFKF